MKFNISFFLILFTLKIFSLEAVLIDFNNLEGTMIDFSKFSKSTNWNDEVKEEMKVDLSCERWTVKVNSSSWTKKAKDKSYVFPIVHSQKFPDVTVLGVRIFFPERHANSYALIEPPFEIPSYYDDKMNPNGMGNIFLNKGVVRNVGVLRKISVLALGNNFRYSLYVRIKDNNNLVRDVFVGYLNFQGWRTISWLNPHLEHELFMREQKKRIRPHYPDEFPYVKLINIMIQRSDPEITGNFVTMIKEITIEYDEAVIETGKTEDFQEEIFGIYQEELVERAKAEMHNVDRQIYLRWEEKKKMHKEKEELEEEEKKSTK
jgi:hypothetical protein